MRVQRGRLAARALQIEDHVRNLFRVEERREIEEEARVASLGGWRFRVAGANRGG